MDYFKKPDRLARWRTGLTAGALLLSAGWWASGLDWNPRGLPRSTDLGRLRASHGPLSRAHATWDSRCDACHVPFTPIAGGSWAAWSPNAAQSSDQRCTACHLGPEHHASQKAGEVVSCANCHRDHRGRDASLVRLPDADCTNCHHDLAAHTAGPARPKYKNVGGFVAAHHPQFKVLRDKLPDPGALKFNHALHMTEGLTSVDGGQPYVIDQIPEADRGRIPTVGRGPLQVVQLNCASCHRLDDADGPPAPVGSNGPSPRNPGAYMLPVTFENHCRACHPLNVDAKPGRNNASLTVRHGLQPDELHADLKNLYIGEYLANDEKALGGFPPVRKVPGRRSPEEEQALAAIADAVSRAERRLLGEGKRTCTECHHYEPPGRDDAARAVAGRTAEPEAPPSESRRIVATKVPTVWFEHGVFDHSAHRAVSCRSCHEGAYAYDERGGKLTGASITDADVLLPGIRSCQQCHAPPSRSPSGSQVVGGAGHACTECHRYHDGDHPLRGIGSPARNARVEFAFEQFLSGVPSTPSPGGARRKEPDRRPNEPAGRE